MSKTGLYKLTGGAANYELEPEEVLDSIKEETPLEDQARLFYWYEELLFWREYGKIYFNLEKARPYYNLTKTFKRLLDSQENDTWLDMGCGPLRVSELIYEKSKGKVKKIEAMDVVLQPARDKLKNLRKRKIYIPVELKYRSITDPLYYPDNFFDGVGANLVLSYVIDFQGRMGKEDIRALLKEIYRVLKPGGSLVWSTPKHNVNFVWVFICSIPDMLNIYEYIFKKDIGRILQGGKILKHALQIQKKGRKGIYSFLPKGDLEELLLDIGFKDMVWERSFAKQALVNRCKKPKN